MKWTIVLFFAAVQAAEYQQVQNPGFEQGAQNWQQISVVFDDLTCPNEHCNSQPASGQGWLQLGGDGHLISTEGALINDPNHPEAEIKAESATIWQEVGIPKANSAKLYFKLKIDQANDSYGNLFSLFIDNELVFGITEQNNQIYVYPPEYQSANFSNYVPIELDISDHALGYTARLEIDTAIVPYDIELNVQEQSTLFLLDDIEIITDQNGPTEPPPAEDINWLENGGFESGTAGWETESNTDMTLICQVEHCGADAGEPYAGQAWARLGGDKIGDWALLMQSFNIEQSEEHPELSFYLKIQSPNANRLDIPLGGLDIYLDGESIGSLPEGDYTHYQWIKMQTQPLSGGPHVLTLKSFVDEQNQSAGTYFLIDEIKLAPAFCSDEQNAVLSGYVQGQCQTSVSIQTQGETTVKSGTLLELNAPQIQLNPSFRVESGGVLKISN